MALDIMYAVLSLPIVCKVSTKHRLTKNHYGIISELDNLALQITWPKDLIANGMMAR